MGFLDWLPGGGEEEGGIEEEVDIDFEEEFEEVEEVEEDPEPETEDVPTFESHYDFADEALQQRGFAGAMDAFAKAMMLRCQNSNRFRDPLKNGVRTIESVKKADEDLRSIGSGDDQSLTELAGQLDEIESVASSVDEIVDEEAALAWEITDTVKEVAGAIADSPSGGSTSGPSTTIESRGGEL